MALLPREPYIPETERLSAEEMDEQRREQTALEYLHRLEEARGWFSECLNADLPPSVELEESMRNGVLLARMANFFAPDIVSERKVFDITEERYKSQGLHFRHTDNIMQWIRAMRHAGLPEVFIPDTTDVYDKKNMPKAVFCIHALSLFLYRKGKAPPMRDVSGNVVFTKEEISMIAEALAQQGIRLPPFSKIGGMLAEELSKDEAELHAAVAAINEAIDSGDPEKTFEQLKNPSAHLDFVIHSNADSYQHSLYEQKAIKLDQSAEKPQLDDLYDRILSRKEIQETLESTNEKIAMGQLNAALNEGTPEVTIKNLQNPILRFPRVWPTADSLYYQELRKQQKAKGADLNYDEVFQDIKVLNSVIEVNQSLDSEEVESLWNALINPQLSMKNLDPENCSRYLYRMRSTREEKAEGSCRFLNKEEIDLCILDANVPLSDEEKRAETLAKLHDAINRGDTVALLELLNNPHAKLTDIHSSNLDMYALALQEAATQRDQAGNSFLKFEEIQDVITQINIDVNEAQKVGAAVGDINQSLLDDAPAELIFQKLNNHSVALGVAVDSQVEYDEYKRTLQGAQTEKKKNCIANENPCGAWSEQATASGLKFYVKTDGDHDVVFRKPEGPLTNSFLDGQDIQNSVHKVNEHARTSRHYDDKVGDLIKAQAQARMWLCRREYQRRLAYLQQQNVPVRKIQKFFRRRQSARDYQALAYSDQPSLRVVRKFATLILQTELDYEEEMELQRLKSNVAHDVRANKKLEEALSVMDLKIGLLVKNRLGVEEVLLHGQRLNAHQQIPSSIGEDINGNRPRSLSKPSREKLESYQQLLYILQTEPQYFTRLLLHLSGSGKITRLIDSVLFPLFNFAMQRREEYFMLKLLKSALSEEIRTKINDLSDLTEGETLISKIIVNLTRHMHGEALLKQMLEPVINDLLAEKKEELNTVPLEIYDYYVGPSPKEMTQEEAAAHPQVAPVFEASLSYMANWAGSFVDQITSCIDKLPYGLRYMAKVMYTTLKEKFPSAPEKDIVKTVGHLICNQYIMPSIANPDGMGIMDSSEMKQKISDDDKKKLITITKLLQYAAVNMGFGGDNAYLAPLNGCIRDLHETLKEYFIQVMKVEEPETVFAMDKYSEITMTVRPVVLLTLGDVAFLHQILLDNESVIIGGKADDPLKQILQKLGPKPAKVDDLVGILTDENQLHEANLGQTEVQIQLSSQFRIPVEEDQESINRNLFLETKKLVLDVILCQQGDTLPEVLSTVATSEQEESHQKLQLDAKLRREAQHLTNEQEMISLEQKKMKIQDNLKQLEASGIVSSQDNYQALVSAIASDIKTERQHRDRRKAESARLKDIVKRLDGKRKYQNEQIEAYNEYIQGCLENLAPKTKRRSIQLDSKRSSKRQSENLDPAKTVKYSGEKLAKKGVLMGIEGTPENQLKNVSIEIETGSAPGVFDVRSKRSNGETQQAELILQDLLKLQYEGSDEITLGKAVFKVDELVFFLNKKFYCS